MRTLFTLAILLNLYYEVSAQNNLHVSLDGGERSLASFFRVGYGNYCFKKGKETDSLVCSDTGRAVSKIYMTANPSFEWSSKPSSKLYNKAIRRGRRKASGMTDGFGIFSYSTKFERVTVRYSKIRTVILLDISIDLE